MPRIALVTGGAGFIGSHLVRALAERQWAVRVLDDLSAGGRKRVPAAVEFQKGDIRDGEACRRAAAGVDTIFHLAARVSVRHSVDTFDNDADVNVLGTLRLLRAAGECRVRRFVYASSMAVYADSRPGCPVDEEFATQPISPYGLGKLAAERYLLLMSGVLGIEPVVLRFFNTFGPGQGYTPYVGVATIFITRMLAGQDCVIYDDGRQCRDFTHVSDVVRACLLAADGKDCAGQTFNIGTGAGTTVNDLAQLLERQIGPGRFRHEPRQAAELRYSVANIGRARRVLGYEPRVTLAEGMPEVIEEIRRRGVAH